MHMYALEENVIARGEAECNLSFECRVSAIISRERDYLFIV